MVMQKRDDAKVSREDSPFVVSETCRGGAASGAERQETHYSIEGHLLVCGKVVILPEVCVLTGSRDDLARQSKSVEYAFWRPAVFRRICRVQYSLARSVLTTRRLVRWIGVGVLALGIGGVMGAVTLQRSWMAYGTPFFGLIYLAIAAWESFQRPRLRLSHYQSPDKYCISGFSPQYLQTLHDELTERRSF